MRIIAFLALTALGFVLLVSAVTYERQSVLICLLDSETCQTYSLSELHFDQTGCVAIKPLRAGICRPAYLLFHLDQLLQESKKSCSKLAGTFMDSPRGIFKCINTSRGNYIYSPTSGIWSPVH